VEKEIRDKTIVHDARHFYARYKDLNQYLVAIKTPQKTLYQTELNKML
jgi:hypothetical protein